MITKRTFLLQDSEGRILASDLSTMDTIALLANLMDHNGISSWTVITQSIEEDCGRCAEEEDECEYGDRKTWYAE